MAVNVLQGSGADGADDQFSFPLRITAMKYVVTGIRPDGKVGLRLSCDTEERANLFADLWRQQHPTWRIVVRPTTGSNATIDIIRPNS